jgi:hypothetical protein
VHRSHSSPSHHGFHPYSLSPARTVDMVYHDIEYLHPLPAPMAVSRELDWRRSTPPPPLPPPPQAHPELCPDVSLGWPPPRHVYSTSPVSSPLLAPPKPRRSRSPGEKSSSSSSRSRSRDRPASHVVWDASSSSRSGAGPSRSSSRRSAVSGYPRVYHPDSGGGPDAVKPSARDRRVHDMREETAVYSGRPSTAVDSEPIVQTRASSRRSREENAPIAKRLRR